jgi:hypothetical protein
MGNLQDEKKRHEQTSNTEQFAANFIGCHMHDAFALKLLTYEKAEKISTEIMVRGSSIRLLLRKYEPTWYLQATEG